MRGYDQTQALEKTLADLGQPHIISAGMTGVYTMPNVIRNTGLMILLSSLGIVSFNAGAQVSGTSQIPIKPCLETNTTNKLVKAGKIRCKDNSSFFLSVAALKADLQPKGVKFEQQESTRVNDLGQVIGKSTFSVVTFPQGEPIVLIQGGPRGYYDAQFEYSKDFVDAETLEKEIGQRHIVEIGKKAYFGDLENDNRRQTTDHTDFKTLNFELSTLNFQL